MPSLQLDARVSGRQRRRAPSASVEGSLVGSSTVWSRSWVLPPSTCFARVFHLSSEPLCGRGESSCSSSLVTLLAVSSRLLPGVTTGGGVSLSGRAPVEITELRRCEWTEVGQHIEAALQHQ